MAKSAVKKQSKQASFSEFFLNVRNVDKRDFGLDLVKVIAMIFVPSVHFFLYNGHYYYYQMGSPDTAGFILTTVIRDLFFICVPLFLLVSGALSYYHPADLTKRHYVKVTPILVTSFSIGALVIIFKLATANPVAADPSLTPYRLLQSLWSGNLPSYGWYVNMYISLFVLMPVIDIAYNALDSQKKKTTMMIACIVLSVLPMSVNKFKFEDTTIGMMPSFFAGTFYPVAYYVVGKYIREFNFKVNKLLLSLILAACLFYQAFKVYFTGLAERKTFFSSMYADNGDLITMVTAVCFFLIIYNINTKNRIVRSIFASVSSLSLCYLLLSWFRDQWAYKDIGMHIHGFGDYFVNFIRIVPLTIILSVLAAYIANAVVKLISKPIMNLFLKHSIIKEKPNGKKGEKRPAKAK